MLVYKSESVGRDDAVYKRLVELLGSSDPRYEDIPNKQEQQMHGFWHWWTIWGAFKAEAHIPNFQFGPKSWASARLLLADHSTLIGGGYLLVHIYSGDRAGETVCFTWRKCLHEFEHKSGGNCYHIYTCKKCGARYDVDSSD